MLPVKQNPMQRAKGGVYQILLRIILSCLQKMLRWKNLNSRLELNHYLDALVFPRTLIIKRKDLIT